MSPLPLPLNVIDHFYRGGERIAALRGETTGPAGEEPALLTRPEEWLGSTVTRWGSDRLGLTDLGSAGLLRDLVSADPEAWLGSGHVARWGSSPALLVKLLDAAQRLPVHVHPTRAFASRHLDCPFGKSEAWVVIDAPEDGGTVFVGTTRAVAAKEWAALVAEQDSASMLGLLRPLTVRPGDAVFVPSGTPHAIDAGLFVVELQEPTDFSVLLEWRGFDVDGATDGHLGLGFDVALDALRRDDVDSATIDLLIRRAEADGGAPSDLRPLLPPVADSYFRAWAIAPDGEPVTVTRSFSVVIVVDGEGTLGWTGDRRAIRRGDAFVSPHAAGALSFEGPVVAVVAQPADPAEPEPVEWDCSIESVAASERVSASERVASNGLRGRGTQ